MQIYISNITLIVVSVLRTFARLTFVSAFCARRPACVPRTSVRHMAHRRVARFGTDNTVESEKVLLDLIAVHIAVLTHVKVTS